MGKQWKQWLTFCFGAPRSLQMLIAAMKLKDTYSFVSSLLSMSLKESYDQPRQHIKKQRHYFVNKGPSSQDYGFSNSHVWMWELDYKESWAQERTRCWRRLLRVHWTARRSNQSILKEISPGSLFLYNILKHYLFSNLYYCCFPFFHVCTFHSNVSF